jgi:hypothetical protein
MQMPRARIVIILASAAIYFIWGSRFVAIRPLPQVPLRAGLAVLYVSVAGSIIAFTA